VPDIAQPVERGTCRLRAAPHLPFGRLVPQQACADDESGRGLALLGAAVDKWGVDVTDGTPGKTVWFEVAQVAQPAVVADDC
jgi:hypothetical protein